MGRPQVGHASNTYEESFADTILLLDTDLNPKEIKWFVHTVEDHTMHLISVINLGLTFTLLMGSL